MTVCALVAILDRDDVLREEPLVAIEGALRVHHVGLRLQQIRLGLAQLIRDVDVLDAADDLPRVTRSPSSSFKSVMRPAMRLVMLTSGASTIPTARMVLVSGGGHRKIFPNQ